MIANLPEGFWDAGRWAARTYPDLPIYITENGIDSSADTIRRRYPGTASPPGLSAQ